MGKKRTVTLRETVRQRVVAVLVNPLHEGFPQRMLAKKLKVEPRTLRAYMRDAGVMAEVTALKSGQVRPEDLAAVDRAMLERAKEGSVAAARLIYMRAGGVPDAEGVPTIEEIEREVERLKKG